MLKNLVTSLTGFCLKIVTEKTCTVVRRDCFENNDFEEVDLWEQSL